MPDSILPLLELDELIEIFEYKNKRAARRAIANGTFPVPIFKLAGRWVAHVDAVRLYCDEQRDRSMKWLRDTYKLDPGDRPPTNPRLEFYRQKGVNARKAGLEKK